MSPVDYLDTACWDLVVLVELRHHNHELDCQVRQLLVFLVEHQERHQIILEELPLPEDEPDVGVDAMLSIQLSENVLHTDFAMVVLDVDFVIIQSFKLAHSLDSKQNLIFYPLFFLIVRSVVNFVVLVIV